MKKLRGAALVVGLAAGVLAVSGTAGAAGSAARHFGNVTCRHGTIKAGTYRSLRIAGTCTLTSTGTVRVKGNVTVGHRATLNTLTPGTFNVGGDLIVKDDAVAGLGCNDEVGCAAESNDHIGGDLRANGAFAVVIEQEHVGGNVTILGGGGSMDCTSTALFGGPYFGTVHDSTVGGNVVMRGVHSCWFGLIRTTVSGNVRLVGNRFGDPDAMEIVTNTVGGNLACFNNNPAAQIGDSGGLPNVVGGQKLGECAGL
jgi:acetyltransferase-like isoleucine patch superfamily enzyme